MRSLLQQLIAPRCPRCGKGKLFKDILAIVDTCTQCGLTLKHHDAADGPTFFALCIIGFAVTLGAVLVEMHYEPPLWVHAALWIPLTLVGSILCLRSFKTILITFEQRLALLKQDTPEDSAE